MPIPPPVAVPNELSPGLRLALQPADPSTAPSTPASPMASLLRTLLVMPGAVLTDEDMEGISLYSSSDVGTPRNAQRVNVVLYRDIAHSLGDDTETGVTNVSMLIEDDGEGPERATGNGTGQERDQTGIEMGGGGGIGVVNNFLMNGDSF